MTKRILKMFLLLVVAVGLYMATNAKADGGAVVVTRTAQATQTATKAAQVCKISTGVENGAVNLRSCTGTSCAVVKILTEGESLNIVTVGAWLEVVTADNARGFINSIYCKGK